MASAIRQIHSPERKFVKSRANRVATNHISQCLCSGFAAPLHSILSPLRRQRSEMRNSYLTTGFLSMALLLAMSVPAAAQSSTTSSPEQKPPEASSPSASPQSTPSQPAPNQAGAASEAAPGPAQSKAQTGEDNPLNLTDEQKAKLRPILVEENQQLDTLRNDTSMTQEQKVSKANEIRQTASPKIRAILTPEQLQKLADLQQKAKQQPNQSKSPGAASPPHP